MASTTCVYKYDCLSFHLPSSYSLLLAARYMPSDREVYHSDGNVRNFLNLSVCMCSLVVEWIYRNYNSFPI